MSLAYKTVDSFSYLNTAVLTFLEVNIFAVFIPRVCILQLIAGGKNVIKRRSRNSKVSF